MWHRFDAKRDTRREKQTGATLKPAALIAAIFLVLAVLAQLLRVVFQVEVTAGGVAVPVWASGIASVFTGGLSFMLSRESCR